MTRPIKFRCFNTTAKCMYPAEHFALTMEGRELQLMPKCEHYDKPYILNEGNMIYMQFTGLLDKNGKEIYEGDVILFGLTRHPVVYFHGCFGLGINPKDNVSHMGEPKDMEIIGNIYENPELLSEAAKLIRR